MSLDGPRPALPREVALHTPEERGRLAARPGLTWFWQVAGRAEVPFAERVRLDLESVARRSLRLDLAPPARTLPALIRGRGAY